LQINDKIFFGLKFYKV